jgi:outer membrane protein assembly factor BamD (BamD/ComL family)
LDIEMLSDAPEVTSMFYKLLCTCALASLITLALPQSAAGQQDRKRPEPVQPPDKALYDRGTAAIKSNHYEAGRLTLQTLINTYPTSAYIPKAQFALAASWYREGGPRGIEQAQTQCKEVIRQFPNSPEAKEAADLLRKIEDAAAKKPDK